jgi:hypothetical protein
MSDPRSEAYERVGGAYEVRVLEPSPPAVPQHGMSPSDEHYAEPYVYVVGTELVVLEYPALLAAADQRAVALEFLRANVQRS